MDGHVGDYLHDDTSLAWLLFMSLPLMALARQLPHGAGDQVAASSQVLLDPELTSMVLLPVNHPLRQGGRRPEQQSAADEEEALVAHRGSRRRLESIPRLVGVVGSRPPKCLDRCGDCTPCAPVNVPVGGAKTDNEYYPEVWRCKCDDRLFMP